MNPYTCPDCGSENCADVECECTEQYDGPLDDCSYCGGDGLPYDSQIECLDCGSIRNAE
jgi:hypothetical protein